jgi:DNA-binding SARP family transcriptional activator
VDLAPTPSGKVVPPGPPAPFVDRPGLMDRLSDALTRRLTCVIAGAGYGKSTLLASWVPLVRGAWYTAGREDSSLAAFGRGLVDALKLRLPDLTDSLSPTLKGLQGPHTDEGARAEALAGILCSALHEYLKRDLVLVIDDLQEVSPQGTSASLIEAMCRQAPDTFHIVLSSRVEPPFPIDRLRGQGQVLEVDATRLVFSQEETAEILRLSIDEDAMALAEPLQRTTHGWPAAVRLAVEALRSSPPDERERIVDGLPRRGGPLFAYLAQEVFAQEPDDARELVRRVAPLRRFTPELCAELGIERAKEILPNLERRGVFVGSEGHLDHWYSINTLGREFASTHLPLSLDEEHDVHRRAGQWFEKNGYFEEALGSLVARGDFSSLAALLREHGVSILDGGAVDRVISSCDALPAEFRDSVIEQLEGQALLVQGDWEGALKCFHRAVGDSGTYPAAIAWRMGLIHYLRGDFRESLEAFERTQLSSHRGRDEALLLAWKASALWITGDVEGCRVTGTEALDAATECGDLQALAAAHTILCMESAMRGDRRKNDEHYFLALSAAQRAGDLLQLVRIGTNRAAHFNEEGMYADALVELERIMPLAETTGFATYLGLCFVNKGEALLGLGRLEEAMSSFEASKFVYERLRSADLCYSFVGMGEVYRERGELAVARAAYEEGVRLADEVGDTQGLVPGLAGLARVIAPEDSVLALELVERAGSLGVNVNQARVLLARGWVLLGTGDKTGAQAVAHQVAAMARERRDRAALAESLELEALTSDPRVAEDRLAEAVTLWEQLNNPIGQARAELSMVMLGDPRVQRTAAEGPLKRLRDLGVRTQAASAGPLSIIGTQPHSPVTILSLGGLRLLREGRPVPVIEWQSKKARDLLKILVARRGRMTPRELLMEFLWPEDEPAKLANRLSVALTTVRSILDPEKHVEPEHFVVADKTAVGLNLDALSIDVEDFLAASQQGMAHLRDGREREGLALLATAEETYTGDFFEEDPYEEWTLALREEARATYISVARTLAHAAALAEDHDSATRYYLRLLERDAFDEDAHLGLIRVLHLAGRHGEARRCYRTYVTRMTELDVGAAPFPSHAAA